MSSQTKITPAIPAISDETKAPTESITTTPTPFYTHKLPATDLSNKCFNKSADLSKQSIQDNPYDPKIGIPTTVLIVIFQTLVEHV